MYFTSATFYSFPNVGCKTTFHKKNVAQIVLKTIEKALHESLNIKIIMILKILLLPFQGQKHSLHNKLSFKNYTQV